MINESKITSGLLFLLAVFIHTSLAKQGAASLPRASHPQKRPLSVALPLYLAMLIAQAILLQSILDSILQPSRTLPLPLNFALLARYTFVERLAILILFAYIEEILFRIFLWHILSRHANRRTLFVVCSSLLFAAYHIQCVPFVGAVRYCNPAPVIHAAAAGVLFALFYARYRHTTATISLHVLYNSAILTAQAVISHARIN